MHILGNEAGETTLLWPLLQMNLKGWAYLTNVWWVISTVCTAARLQLHTTKEYFCKGSRYWHVCAGLMMVFTLVLNDLIVANCGETYLIMWSGCNLPKTVIKMLNKHCHSLWMLGRLEHPCESCISGRGHPPLAFIFSSSCSCSPPRKYNKSSETSPW